MNDVDTTLAELFDEVAASIEPSPDFEAVVRSGGPMGPVATATGGGRSFRRGVVAAAAVALVLGGAAAAFELDDEPSMVATDETAGPPDARLVIPDTTVAESPREFDDAVVDDAVPANEEVRSAELGIGRLDTDPIRQIVVGQAAPGERVTIDTPFGGVETTADGDGRWKAVLELATVPPTSLVPIEVRFDGDDTVVQLTIVTPAASPEPKPEPAPVPAPAPKPEPQPEPKAEPPTTTVAVEQPKSEPKPEPKPEPKEQPPTPVEFTATLGASYVDATPMKQTVQGTATPGTEVLVTSAYGHTTVVAGDGGWWEAHLKMHEVPAGTNVRITVSAAGFPQQYEFWVARPQAEVKPFSAEIGWTHLDGDPIKVVFQGTGAPGSKVTATSDHGTADTVIGENGSWELKLYLHAVPSGTTVGVRVSDTASGAAKDFSVTAAEPPAPEHHFKANAAFVDSKEDPPYNDYSGTAEPGSTVTISSPYGGTQVNVGESGSWTTRVEFPTAPIGEKFQVVLTNSASDHSFSFGFQRLTPP